MALDPKEYSAVVKVRSGRQQPDLINSIALKTLTKEQAAAEQWTTYYVPQPCANGHVASRFVKNDGCVSCWLVKQGREPLYPMAKNRTYYKQRTPDAVTATGAPVVIAAPTPPEPKPVEQKYLAALAELRDLDAAALAVGLTRGLVESRASSNPVFKAALEDLMSRLSIAWTRAPDAETYRWTSDIEKQFARRYVDCGLIEQTRSELGVSASDYHAHIAASANFSALIAAAEPLARLTLRDRATRAAESGNDRLLKLLQDTEPQSVSTMSHTQLNAELQKLLERFEARGLLPRYFIEKSTGRTVDFRDCIPADDYTPASVDDSNADLVSL